MSWQKLVVFSVINVGFYFWGMHCGEQYIKGKWPPSGHCRSGAFIIGSEIGSWACNGGDKWEQK